MQIVQLHFIMINDTQTSYIYRYWKLYKMSTYMQIFWGETSVFKLQMLLQNILLFVLLCWDIDCKHCCLKCYLSFRRHQYILLSFYAQWFEDCLIHGVWIESKYSTKRKHILLPMPAAAKYSATGEPRPPAPTTKIDDLRRFCCPAQMIIQSIPWTLHLI